MYFHSHKRKQLQGSQSAHLLFVIYLLFSAGVVSTVDKQLQLFIGNLFDLFFVEKKNKH